nr:protein nuclear fusion defective 4 [Quercus suber]
MAGQSRKWLILVATTWIQAFTGTNFDFSSYSSDLKTVLEITQWLVIRRIITLPYFLVFLLSLMAGCGVCWFNTVCYVLCIRNFPVNRPLALSLTISFNGVTAAIYTLIANAINPNDDTIYLFLNALVPLFTSGIALFPILCQPPLQSLTTEAIRRDSFIFLCLNILAVITGLYLLLLNSLSSNVSVARILFGGALGLLVLPLCLPGIVYAREWARRNIYPTFRFDNSSFNLIDPDDLELHKELIGSESNGTNGKSCTTIDKGGCFGKLMEKDRLIVLGEEHPARLLVRRWDFWLYYLAYFCGGTLGLVYSNNLGQISQSLGYSSITSSLVTLYSTCSFFGRLLSAAPDFLRNKVYFARTGWLAVALVPTPIAFFLLASSGSEAVLRAGTGLIGLSSGFLFSAAVSITSELFGPNSAGVNHNILITNIPIGSLLYGLLAALVYDSNAGGSALSRFLGETMWNRGY